MNKQTRSNFIGWFFAVVVSLLLTACGGGGGGGGGGNDNPPAPPIGDVSGKWYVTENNKNHNCLLNPGLKDYILTVEQNGNTLTVVANTGERFTGTLDGAKLNWSGSYAEDAPDGTEGRTTLERMSATVDASCDKLTGSSNWRWTSTEGDGYSCSGTTSFSGSRSPARGCGGSNNSGSDDDQSGGNPSGGGSGPGSGDDTEAPSVPSGMSATAASSSAINLRWSASTDNVGVTGYDIYRDGRLLMTVSDTGATDTGLSADTNYCYSIAAKDAAGNVSARTASTCERTQSLPVSKPAGPSSVSVTGISHDSATITWRDNADNETGYRIGTCSGLVSVDSYGNRSCSSGFTLVATLGANAQSYTLTGLSAETNYAYYVLAYNSAGTSFNRGVRFTTTAAPVTSSVTITNNLPSVGSSHILQLRIASSEAAVRSDRNELLSPDDDGRCFPYGPESISSGDSSTYAIPNSLAAGRYYVFIGLGLIDSSICSYRGFAKKMWSFDSSSGKLYYIFGLVSIESTAGRNLEIRVGYNNNRDIVMEFYEDGAYMNTLTLYVSSTDPTTP